MKKYLAAVCAVLFFALGAVAQDGASQTCASLSQLRLAAGKVVAARMVTAGSFEPPAGAVAAGRDKAFYKTLPAFCQVAIVSTPSADSDITIDVWMPATGWNGRFRAQGNGGFAGYIDYQGMGVAVREGYATASTDTGHTGTPTDAAWALNHPQKVIDFGYRAIHEMTVAANAAIQKFYGEAPRHSYFASCSNGGRQALMEVQRFPDDYDGVIAGAPANFWTPLLTSALWNAQALAATPDGYIPSSKIPAIAAAVNAACDTKDGVRDGILNDPRECHFDARTLLCKGGDSVSCLTAPQVTTLQKLYEGAHDAQGHAIYPGFLPGGEAGAGGWALWITGPGPGRSLLFAFGKGFFADMVYDKASWNYKSAELGAALRAADAKTARDLNATNPNLRTFEEHRGKLILYHGWDDPAISPLNTIHYYDSMLRSMGEKNVNAFVRLYMVPGMQHCGGGPGADSFGEPGALRLGDAQHDIQVALQGWVEKGIAPERIIATKYEDDDPSKGVKMTRPLCPYPERVKYKGSGNPDEAANFTCVAGK